jgi:hypothetical protein
VVEIKKYEDVVAYSSKMLLSSFMKICPLVQKLIWGKKWWHKKNGDMKIITTP